MASNRENLVMVAEELNESIIAPDCAIDTELDDDALAALLAEAADAVISPSDNLSDATVSILLSLDLTASARKALTERMPKVEAEATPVEDVPEAPAPKVTKPKAKKAKPVKSPDPEPLTMVNTPAPKAKAEKKAEPKAEPKVKAKPLGKRPLKRVVKAVVGKMFDDVHNGGIIEEANVLAYVTVNMRAEFGPEESASFDDDLYQEVTRNILDSWANCEHVTSIPVHSESAAVA